MAGVLCFFEGQALAATASSAETVPTSTAQEEASRILGGKASIQIPGGFEKMSAADIARNYPMANPLPREVWYTDTGKGMVSLVFFSPFPTKTLKDAQVPKLAEMMKTQMVKQRPTLTTDKMNGHTVSRLQSVAPDATGNGSEVHTITQLSSLNQRLLMVTFNMPVSLKDEYLPIGLAALDTLKY